jgi:hypothetical protein
VPRIAPGHAPVLLAGALITARNHIDHAVTAHPAGAEAVRIGLIRRASMQVPMTVQPPADDSPLWVVRT